jgi:ABC-2 type transport system permease protein
MTQSFNLIIFLMMFFAPILTMRLLAEEHRQGTIELLLTSPVRDWEIVVGKFIASLALLVAILVPTLWQVALLFRYTNPGSPDVGKILAGYLGTFLAVGAMLAIGLFTSSLSQNQVIAAVISMVTLVMLWIINSFASVGSGAVSDFLTFISIPGQFRDFLDGVIDTNHILYFVSVAAISLFIATRMVESRRWR